MSTNSRSVPVAATAKEVINRLKWDPELLGSSSKNQWPLALVFIESSSSTPRSRGCRSWIRTGACSKGTNCKHSHECDLSYLEGMLDGKSKSSSGMSLIRAHDVSNLKEFNIKLAHRVVFISVSGTLVFDAEYPQVWQLYLEHEGLLPPSESSNADVILVQSQFPLVCLQRVLGFLQVDELLSMSFVCKSWKLDVAMNTSFWQQYWERLVELKVTTLAAAYNEYAHSMEGDPHPSFCLQFRCPVPWVQLNWTFGPRANNYTGSLNDFVLQHGNKPLLHCTQCTTQSKFNTHHGTCASISNHASYVIPGGVTESVCITDVAKVMTCDFLVSFLNSIDQVAERVLPFDDNIVAVHISKTRGLVTVVTESQIRFYDSESLNNLLAVPYPQLRTSEASIRLTGLSGQYFVQLEPNGEGYVINTSDTDVMEPFNLWSCLLHGIGVTLGEFLYNSRAVGLEVVGRLAVLCVQTYDTVDDIGGDLTAVVLDLETKVVVSTMTIGCFEAIFHQVQLKATVESPIPGKLRHPKWLTVFLCYMPSNLTSFRMALDGGTCVPDSEHADSNRLVSITQQLDPNEVSYHQNSADVYGMQVISVAKGVNKVVVYCAKNCLRFFDLDSQMCNVVHANWKVHSIDPCPLGHGYFFLSQSATDSSFISIWDARLEAPVSSGHVLRASAESPRIMMGTGIGVCYDTCRAQLCHLRPKYPIFQRKLLDTPKRSGRKSRKGSKSSSRPNRTSRESKANMHKRKQ